MLARTAGQPINCSWVKRPIGCLQETPSLRAAGRKPSRAIGSGLRFAFPLSGNIELCSMTFTLHKVRADASAVLPCASTNRSSPSIRALIKSYGKRGSRLCGGDRLSVGWMAARNLLNGIGPLGERQAAARKRRKAAAKSVHPVSAAVDPNTAAHVHRIEGPVFPVAALLLLGSRNARAQDRMWLVSGMSEWAARTA